MIFDILFLPLVLFIGLMTSYEDIKYGKVRNKWIILGLSWGLLVIVFFFIWHFIASPITRYYYFEIQNLPDNSPAPVFTVSLGYLGRIVLNATIAFTIAFLMWRSDAWAAGDAKLFAIYSLLIPLGHYWKSYLSYFPSFTLLINIFIPIFLYLLIRSAIYFLRFLYLKISQPQVIEKKKLFDKKKMGKKLKNMGIMFLGFISIFLFFGLFQEPIKNSFNIDTSSLQMFIFAGFIIFSSYLSKIFQKAITFKIISVFLLLMLVYGFSSFPSATWQIIKQTIQNMIVFMIVLGLFKSSIDFHVLKTGSKEIKIEELGPWMNLDEAIISEMKKDEKYYHQYIGRIYPEGLTLEQAEFIKKWLKEKKKENEIIKIYKPFPFVAWMFLGVIITLILKRSVFHLFLNLK